MAVLSVWYLSFYTHLLYLFLVLATQMTTICLFLWWCYPMLSIKEGHIFLSRCMHSERKDYTFRLNMNQVFYFMVTIAGKCVDKNSLTHHSCFCGGTLTMIIFVPPDLNALNLLPYPCWGLSIELPWLQLIQFLPSRYC